MHIWRAVQGEGSDLEIWPKPRRLPPSLAGIGIIESEELGGGRMLEKSVVELR